MRLSAGLFVLLAPLGCAQQMTVSVLASTDMHGNIFPVDYVTDRPADRGLAKLATLIRAARADNPNNVLIDCGDTIQGTPLEYSYQTLVRTGKAPLGIAAPAGIAQDPMMRAMNLLKYDAMAVGNHEFNFGPKNLNAARADANFPWISANIDVSGPGQKPFAPYIVKTVAGVKVAIVGITTPYIPNWEKPENIAGYSFRSPVEALRKVVAGLRRKEKPDVIVVAAHSGLGRNLDTGDEDLPEENVAYALATSVPDVDAILFGHTHGQMEGRRVGNVLLVQPKNWAISLARIDFAMERKPEGGFRVAARNSRLISVTAQTAAAADVLALAKPYHDLAEKYLNTPVADSPRDLSAAFGRYEDTAVVDAVQAVQTHYAKADVSFTALFNPAVRLPRGKVTVRQIAALYPYENELFAIEGDGRMVKDALENAARYFLSCQAERCSSLPLVHTGAPGYNFDIAQGVSYEIDLTRPEGDRIRNLRYRGTPLQPAQPLRIAINNYRAGGSAGYTMFAKARIAWRSHEEIRDLIVRYFTERKQIPADPDYNWRIVPEAAVRTLENGPTDANPQ